MVEETPLFTAVCRTLLKALKASAPQSFFDPWRFRLFSGCRGEIQAAPPTGRKPGSFCGKAYCFSFECIRARVGYQG